MDLRDRLLQTAAYYRTRPKPHGWPCHSIEEFVAREGQYFRNDALDDEERAVVQDALARCRREWGRFLPRQCFANGQMLVLSDASRSLRYVEGYAIKDDVREFAHAWVVLHGKVIDVMGARPCDVGEASALTGAATGTAFYGVQLRRAYVRERMTATGTLGALLHDGANGYPLFKSNTTPPRAIYDAAVVRAMPSVLVPEGGWS